MLFLDVVSLNVCLSLICTSKKNIYAINFVSF